MRLSRVVRASDWWEYKIAPVLGAFYGTLLIARVPVSAAWRDALALLAAIVAQAIYVSVINDLTDREADLAAGKPPRDAGALAPLLLAASIAAGTTVIFFWRHNLPLVVAYAAGWIAFSLYSLPPFRFKTRGILGVACDASGAHLFPTLTAVLLAPRVSVVWMIAAVASAFASGVRGIFWHQLRDAEADARTGVQTFVTRRGAAAATRVATFAAFPIELVALAVMLWQLRSLCPVVALAVYATLMLRRPRRYGAGAAIVTSGPRSFMVLTEFHDAYLPVAILVASALAHPADFIVLAAHFAAFPATTRTHAREIAGLARLGRRRA